MERQTQSTISNANQCARCVLKSHFELAANNCFFCRSRQDKYCCALSHVCGILQWSAGSLSLMTEAIVFINGNFIKSSSAAQIAAFLLAILAMAERGGFEPPVQVLARTTV